MPKSRTGISLRLALVIAIVTWLAIKPANAQQTAVIAGNHSPSIEHLAAARPAPAGKSLEMSIALSPTNQRAVDALLDAQQDPSSPQYHQWLKPGEFDSRFGPESSSHDAIVRWLTGGGFSIVQSKSNRWAIGFTGTVAQAERAFGVAINSPDEGKHFANLEDPSVPASFASAIGHIDGLDNLRGWRDTMHIVPGSPAADPLVKFNGQTGFAPSDFYTFYDETPLLRAGINGSGGGCIGLIEVSDYSATGIANFDKAFKLPAAQLTKVIPSDSDNPGQNSRVGETMLDIEYAHAIAPGAPISVYIADPATNSNNVILATVDALNAAVNQDTCTSLSISIETCGFSNSFFTGNLHTTYMKAASQGQTVFVAEGDEGAAEFQFDSQTGQCVNGTSRNVNELASDPDVTSIGGTQFKPDFNSRGNDVGFVAESVWNEPQFTAQEIGAGGGGASTVWSKPAFQNTGTPADGARDVPDISMEAACVTPGAFSVFPDQASGNKVVCCACGTSLGAPIWAGITELMVQGNGQQRLGSINTRLYELGNLQDTAATGIRDVTIGNNDFNGVTGFDAVPGFDLASGWGTPDIATFVSAFVAANTVDTKLTIAPTMLKFNGIPEGKTSKPQSVTIRNASSKSKPILVAIANEAASAPFAVSSQCSTTLLPGKTCKVMVTFSPTDAVEHMAQLSIADNDTGAPQMVPLTGTGRAPK